MKLLLPFAFAALTSPMFALAGPQYIDETGFAVSGHDVVAYFNLQQNPVGQKQPTPVKGNATITAEHNGATWAFSTVENREKFLADPEQYVPQYNGHCAYGVSKGGKVPANPQLWRIIDGKLYLNVTQDVVGFWEEDISGNLQISEKKWPKLEPAKASTRTIPFFTSEAPVSN
jgi:YHS domain-containing protein